MLIAVRRLLFCFLLSVAALAVVAVPLSTAEQSSEVAARALLGEAEKLMECALPQEALPVLDKVKSGYPGTEAASFAELRKAQSLFFLYRYDEAETVARSIISAHPGTVLSGWATSILGQVLVDKGQVSNGIAELKKVETMLPDRKDLGPLNEAREALGRLCLIYLTGRNDDLDAVDYLGLSRSSASAKAKVLAILAVTRAKKGNIAEAKQTLTRLASEIPTETVEISWAKAEVAICELLAESSDTAASEAAETLNNLASVSMLGDYEAAKACLMLGRKHLRKGQVEEAVTILQLAVDKYAATGVGAEILYQVGNALYRQGRPDEAVSFLKKVVDDTPKSGFAAPALYCIGTNGKSNQSAALEALTKLAEGGYDNMWRGLAHWRLGDFYRTTDKAKARDHYTKAQAVFQEYLATLKADVGEWRDTLQTRIDIMGAEIEALGEGR